MPSQKHREKTQRNEHIRKLHANGMTQAELAAMFGLNPSRISQICTGQIRYPVLTRREAYRRLKARIEGYGVQEKDPKP